MTRVKSVEKEEASENVASYYKTLESKLGRLPNIFKNMGNSAAVLHAYLSLNEALGETSFSQSLREMIALTVSERNQCSYCLAAHTAMAQGEKMSDSTIISARNATAEDTKTNAILQFAKKLVDNRGHVTDNEVKELKEQNVTDKEITEIVLVVITNMFTNYFNHVTDPDVDFPKALELN